MFKKYFKTKRTTILLWSIFLIGLFFRLGLSFLNRSGDLNNHIIWTDDFLKFGSIGFYEREFIQRRLVIAPNYPPLIIFFFIVSQWLYQFANSLVWFLNVHISIFPSNMVAVFKEDYIREAFYKLPAICSDMGIAYLVYKIARYKYNKSYSVPFIATVSVLFNPAFFYNSSYWGQVDSVPLFFMLLAFYSYLLRKKKLLPIFFVCCALLSKQTMVVFIPVWFVLWIKEYSYKEKLYSLLLIIFTFLGMFFLFHKNGFDFVYPFVIYISKILLVSGVTHVTNHAFNFWYIVTGGRSIEDVAVFLLHTSYKVWGNIVVGIATIAILYSFFKKKLSSEYILYAATLFPFISFLFLTRMHERHLESVLPFLLLLYVYTGKYFRWFVYLSLFHFINLYHGWWQPEFPFFGTVKMVLSPPSVIYLLISVTVYICLLVARDFFSTEILKNSQKLES